MRGYERHIDNINDILNELSNGLSEDEKIFERIADMARGADEDNWKTTIDTIFAMVYDRY